MSKKKPTPDGGGKKKTEVSLVRSSAAEYLTFVAASGQGGVEAVYADEEAAVWVDRILPLASRQRNSNNSKMPSSASSSLAEEKIDGVLADSIEHENIVQLDPELVALHA